MSGALIKLKLSDRAADALRTLILDGRLPPGAPVVELHLARDLGISRAPLREAMRQLVEEGLLVSRPYGGTTVLDLDARQVIELFSLRTTLEIFAFELIWDCRDEAFAAELRHRDEMLRSMIDSGDGLGAIRAELALHSLVYERAGHQQLLQIWGDMKGRLQLYWAAHQRAHGRRGPKRDAHGGYIAAATGNSLEGLRTEIRDHMQRGLLTVEDFVRHEAQRNSPE